MTDCDNACAQLRFIARTGINIHKVCPVCGAGYRGDGFVYAIQAGGPGGPVKIGYSRNPWRRLRQLQTGNPAALRLLAAEPNAIPEDERRAHDAIKSFAEPLNGEWFTASAVGQFVRDMVDSGFGCDL